METNNPAQKMEEVNNSSSVSSSGNNPRMAGFGERLLAFLIDAVVIFAVVFPLQFAIGVFTGIGSALSNSSSASYASNGMMGFSSLMGLALQFAYFGWFNVNKGQTIGKMAMKIKTVRSVDLKYLSWGESFIREILGRIVSGLVFYLGYLWYFMSPKRQTWHDMIASTYVVKTDDNGGILMDGPESYKKEPVKTFGCCGGMALIFIAIIAMFVYGIILFGQSLSNGSMDTDFKYNNSGMMKQDTDLTEEEMRKMLEDAFREGINSDDSTETAPNAL